jgi:hypothetical protein
MNKITQQLKRRFSQRGLSFSDEVLSTLIDRVIIETPGLDLVALAEGEASAQNQLLAAISTPPSEVAFSRTVELVQGVAAVGDIHLTAQPADGDTVTVDDSTNPAVIFEFDAGDKATGTLGLTGQPADADTFTLGDGTHTPIFEFDSGTTGVASTGCVLTFGGIPVNGEIVTLKKANGTAVIFQFKTSGLADEGNKMVFIGSATTADKAAKELMASINGTGPYAGNFNTGFSATRASSGVLHIVRTATGAGNETVTSGTHQVETATASGSITTSGNASVVVTGVGIAGSPLTTAVAVTAGALQKETATVVGTVTPGTPQVETATVVGTVTAVTGGGDATVIVTAAGMTGSPKTIAVTVVAADSASVVGGKIRTALGLDANVTALFTVGGSGALVSLTALTAAANDATLNIDIDNGTCTGLTDAPTSTNTTPGIAPGTGNATVIVTAAGMTNSPKTISVAVVASDSANTVAGKIRTALGIDADVSPFFTISGSTSAVIAEAKIAAANDATMNVDIDNGTCTGLTDSPTSSNTTAGLAFDTAAAWAAKVRTALGSVGAITTLYTVGGSSAAITLTSILASANDSTLNISLATGTAAGITAALTSVDTTSGNSGSAVVVTTSFSGGVTAVTPGAGITGGHVGVAIAATAPLTRNNLVTAINAQTALLFTAIASTGNDTILTAKTAGTAGNSFTMVKSGANLTVSGAGSFASGTAAGSGVVTGTNTAVALGATAALSATALHNAITSASLDVASTNSPAGHCALANTKANGAGGNIPVTKTGANITVTGMSGGANSAAEIISDAEVGAGRKVVVTSFIALVQTTTWTDATHALILGNDDHALIDIPVSLLVADAPVFPTTATVVLDNEFLLGSGGADGVGLKAESTGNEETGGTLTITVSGVIKGV